MKHITTPCRKAYTLVEFAEMFGHHRSWAYRQVTKGRIQTISGFGKQLIPAFEVDRILGITPQSNRDSAHA